MIIRKSTGLDALTPVVLGRSDAGPSATLLNGMLGNLRLAPERPLLLGPPGHGSDLWLAPTDGAKRPGRVFHRPGELAAATEWMTKAGPVVAAVAMAVEGDAWMVTYDLWCPHGGGAVDMQLRVGPLFAGGHWKQPTGWHYRATMPSPDGTTVDVITNLSLLAPGSSGSMFAQGVVRAGTTQTVDLWSGGDTTAYDAANRAARGQVTQLLDEAAARAARTSRGRLMAARAAIGWPWR